MDKQDITFEFIECEDSGIKEFFDRLLKLYGEPATQPLKFPPCKLNGVLVELGFPADDGKHIKEMMNDILLVSGLAKVQTSDGKITIEQTCE